MKYWVDFLRYAWDNRKVSIAEYERHRVRLQAIEALDRQAASYSRRGKNMAEIDSNIGSPFAGVMDATKKKD